MDKFVDRNVVLVIGSGLPGQAEFPSFRKLVMGLSDALIKDDADRWQHLRKLVDVDPTPAAELIAARLERSELVSLLSELHPAHFEGPLPNAYRILSDLPCLGAIATTWDDLANSAFSLRTPATSLLPSDTEAFPAASRGENFFLLNAFGRLEFPSTVLFTWSEFSKALRENSWYARFIADVLERRTVLFLGMGLPAIEIISRHAHAKAGETHYALIPFNEHIDFEAESFRFRELYGVDILEYRASSGYPEVGEFCRVLLDRVKSRTRERQPLSLKESQRTISKLELSNIGPFKEYAMQFTQEFNLLLGDNASGKTSALRSLALALCPEVDGGALVAEGLLRYGCQRGKVEVTFGDGSSSSLQISRTPEGVHLKPRGISPVEAGTLLIIGFPALRGLGGANRQGVGSQGPTSPTVEDLQPLVRGRADHRMRSLRQWILDVSVRAENNEADKRLLDFIFEALSKVSNGQEIQYVRTDYDAWSVLISVDGVDLPIEQLSQGFNSLFGWMGTLIQRLFETRISEQTRDALGDIPSIVILDEIDAHLHPQWQRTLVPALRELFPRTQFITTSHSPLVAASCQAGEVQVLRSLTEPGPLKLNNLRGSSVDTILTGASFGLETAKDVATERDLRRMIELSTSLQLNANEESELSELSVRLGEEFPSFETRALTLQAIDIIEKAMMTEMQALLPDESSALRQEVARVLRKIISGSGLSDK